MTARIYSFPRLFPGDDRPMREFLPAALEIVETPASPTMRLTAGIICLFILTAVLWAWVGHVDMIASAPGKVVAAGRTKQIQVFEAGVVRDIKVDDGDTVHQGQTLVVLDPTLPEADRDHFKEILTHANLDKARLTGELNLTQDDPFKGIDASPALIADARGRMAADRAEEVSKLAAQDREIASKRSERASTAAEIAKIDADLPIAQEQQDIQQKGLESQFGSRLTYLNAAEHLVELQNERKVQSQKLASDDAGIQALISERSQYEAEFKRDRLGDLTKAANEAAEAEGELAKAVQRTGLTTITAPVDGVVQDLSVHTLGGVVQAGQQLLRIVPNSGAVEIEAIVENKDTGFVHAGQEVEIKVETFPFTRYGLIHGHVVSVARDAAPDPELMQQSRAASNTEGPGDQPSDVRRAGGLVYVASIAMPDASVMVDGVKTQLEPGMAVTAEIKTGRRRVLDYILSPIAQHAHDAMRER